MLWSTEGSSAFTRAGAPTEFARPGCSEGGGKSEESRRHGLRGVFYDLNRAPGASDAGQYDGER